MPLRFAESGSTSTATATSGEMAQKLTFQFVTPSQILYSDPAPQSPPKHEVNKVDMVIVPGSDGVIGILPNHANTVAQLHPGVVSIQETADSPVVKYFISGGFAIVKNSHLSVTAVEAVPLEELDPTAVTEGLEKFRVEMERETEPLAKAKAQIAYEVHFAMNAALGDVKH